MACAWMGVGVVMEREVCKALTSVGDRPSAAKEAAGRCGGAKEEEEEERPDGREEFMGVDCVA